MFKRYLKPMPVASIVVGTLAGLSVFAGDGQGVNGPTLSPISIPIESDYGVDTAAVAAAVKTCVITGDAKSGLVSLQQKIFRYLFGSYPSQNAKARYFIAHSTGDRDPYIGDHLPPNEAGSICVHSSEIDDGGDRYMEGVQFCSTTPIGNLSTSKMTVSIGRGTHHGFAGDRSYQFDMPSLRYQRVVTSKMVRDGNSVWETGTVYGLSIDPVPGEGDDVILWEQTDDPRFSGLRRTGYRVNVAEYVQCLQSEIQKQVQAGQPAAGEDR